MNALETLAREVIGFLQLGPLLQVVRSGDYGRLLTPGGMLLILIVVVPALLVVEVAVGLVRRRFQTKVYKVTFLTYVANRVLGSVVTFSAVLLLVGALRDVAPFHTSLTWYWFVYAYLVWELGHWIYHYLCHKVRLLWCLHSTHHAPEDLNLSVNYAHFFLELPFAAAVRTTVAMLLGVDPALVVLIVLVAPIWGSFVHVGHDVLRNGRLGWLEQIILTPSHHRVHHARNPLYIDRNYCNLFNVWDRLFGTYQEEHPDVRPEYGITRAVDSGSFLDVYFGEPLALIRDVRRAPTWRDKLRYLLMPPGWSHTGAHRTAAAIRAEYLTSRVGAAAPGLTGTRMLRPDAS